MKGLTFRLVKKTDTNIGWDTIKVIDVIPNGEINYEYLGKTLTDFQYTLCCVCDGKYYTEICKESLIDEIKEGIYEL